MPESPVDLGLLALAANSVPAWMTEIETKKIIMDLENG